MEYNYAKNSSPHSLILLALENASACGPEPNETTEVVAFHHEPSALLFIVLTSLISLLGLVGNVATIMRVVTNVRFKGAFFCAFACLSFADLVSLLVYYIRVYQDFGLLKIDPKNHKKEIFFAFNIMAVHSSAAHLVLVACFRYIFLTHPLYFRCHITPRSIVHMSILCWSISVLVAVGYAFYDHAYYNSMVNMRDDAGVQLFLSLYVLFVPLFVFIFLHCLQIKALNSSLLSEKSKTKRKLSHMMFIIAFIYTVCFIPFLTRNILIVLQENGIVCIDKETYKNLRKQMQNIAMIFQVLNYSVNPIVYIFYSSTFGRIGRVWTKHSRRGYSESLLTNHTMSDIHIKPDEETKGLVRVATWPTINKQP